MVEYNDSFIYNHANHYIFLTEHQKISGNATTITYLSNEMKYSRPSAVTISGWPLQSAHRALSDAASLETLD